MLNYYRINNAIIEAEKHQFRIELVGSELKRIFPMTLEKYKKLTDLEVERIDQLIYRFTKLQDTVGLRLIPALYSYLEQNDKKVPFIDILNKLERYDLLDVSKWQMLRALRNSLAYEYNLDEEENRILLNQILLASYDLIMVFEKLKNRMIEKYEKNKL